MKLNNVTSVNDDGRYIHTFSQSFLNSFLTCPEQARYDIENIIGWQDHDGNVAGTVLHQVIEEVLTLQMEDGIIIGADIIGDIVEANFRQSMNYQHQYADREWTWVKRDDSLPILWKKRDPSQALAFVHACALKFVNEVAPDLVPISLEEGFNTLVYQDGGRIVYVAGNVDYIDGGNRFLVDWKTASRPYKKWERQRWAVQPTVYTYGICDKYGINEEVPFDYIVFMGDTWETISVTRGPEHWAWMEQQLRSIVPLLEAQLPTWPKNDNHVLCSPRWCDVFAAGKCKGAAEIPEKWTQKDLTLRTTNDTMLDENPISEVTVDVR